MELTKDSAYNSPGPRQSFFDLTTGGGGPPIIKREPRKLPGTSVYRTISGILGFKEPPSLALYVIFGGALLGFCLFYVQMFSMSGMRRMTIPGEWFWLGFNEFFHVNYSIHIYLSCIGGSFSLLQFLPAIRRRFVLFHRINGYFVLLTLIPANICGAIAGNRAFGGEINAQSAYYSLGILTVGCFLMGIFNVKRDTRQHRKWMIRGVVIFSVAITTRLIVLAAREIVTDIGNYYSVCQCLPTNRHHLIGVSCFGVMSLCPS
ncbi:hypothetical protein CPB85DRAFT_1217483 [Mucidula mucida]|nr:hypothetical protein CPB85DRAFT_1217483 [Mucidula mucida]